MSHRHLMRNNSGDPNLEFVSPHRTHLARPEQWYQSNPGCARDTCCKSECSHRSDSTGYGSYMETSNNNFGTINSLDSSNASSSNHYDHESIAYYSGSATSDDSAISGHSLDAKDPEACIDDFFRAPELYDIEHEHTNTLRRDTTLGRRPKFVGTKLERIPVAPILDEVQPTPELRRKDMADMARNVLHMINDMKLDNSEPESVPISIPSCSRSQILNNNKNLEMIPEEHIYEEINYDCLNFNMDQIDPPPLPARNPKTKLVRFQSDQGLQNISRYYGTDGTISPEMTSPNMMRFKRKIPSRHVFDAFESKERPQKYSLDTREPVFIGSRNQKHPSMNPNRCFSYDSLPTDGTLGRYPVDSLRISCANDIFKRSSPNLGPPEQIRDGTRPPSNATLRRWWLKSKRQTTRV